MLKFPEGLPESMFVYLVDCEADNYIPSADEFEEALKGEPELDYWMDELQLPELRQELTFGEVDDEVFQKPLTLRQEYKSRGLKLTDFY